MKYHKGIILALIACSLAFAQAEETREGEKLKLIPVFEKTFDDTIVDVIFDIATVTIEEAKRLGWKRLEGELSKEMTKIYYPKVIQTRKTIKFLDKYGVRQKEWKECENTNIFSISRNGRFVTVLSVLKGDEHKHIPTEISFSVLNTNGDIVWSRDDIPPSVDGVMIAENGDYAVAPSLWEKGRLRFFNSSGLVCKVDPLKDGSEGENGVGLKTEKRRVRSFLSGTCK